MSQVALYARVSTTDPHAEVQLADLRAYANAAPPWMDDLIAAARRREVVSRPRCGAARW